MQTPVLAMIVRRDDEIRTFKPEPFWELLTRYRDVTFKFAGDRFAKEEDAQSVLQRVQGHPLIIRGVERKPERVQPPQLYDLTELQRDMNRRFGLSADATLKAAQSLYEAKLISYPRTDSRYLSGRHEESRSPASWTIFRALKPDEIGKLDLGALAFTGRIINDTKVSDHHAIIPTGKPPGSPLAGGPEGLRRRRHPPDRRLLPGVRQGSDDRRRSHRTRCRSGPGACECSSRAGPCSTPASRTRQGRRRAGAARVPPRRERPARAVRPAGRDDAAEALHRGQPARGDGDGRQARRGRAAQGGAQGAGPGHAGDAGGDHRDPAGARLHHVGTRRRWPRRTWAATSWPSSRTEA